MAEGMKESTTRRSDTATLLILVNDGEEDNTEVDINIDISTDDCDYQVLDVGSAPLLLLSLSSAKKDMRIKAISKTDNRLNFMIKRRQTQSGDDGIWDFGVRYVADRENDSKANDVSKKLGYEGCVRGDNFECRSQLSTNRLKEQQRRIKVCY